MSDPPLQGTAQTPYVEFPFDRLIDFNFGGPVAILQIDSALTSIETLWTTPDVPGMAALGADASLGPYTASDAIPKKNPSDPSDPLTWGFAALVDLTFTEVFAGPVVVAAHTGINFGPAFMADPGPDPVDGPVSSDYYAEVIEGSSPSLHVFLSDGSQIARSPDSAVFDKFLPGTWFNYTDGRADNASSGPWHNLSYNAFLAQLPGAGYTGTISSPTLAPLGGEPPPGTTISFNVLAWPSRAIVSTMHLPAEFNWRQFNPFSDPVKGSYTIGTSSFSEGGVSGRRQVVLFNFGKPLGKPDSHPLPATTHAIVQIRQTDFEPPIGFEADWTNTYTLTIYPGGTKLTARAGNTVLGTDADGQPGVPLFAGSRSLSASNVNPTVPLLNFNKSGFI